MKGFRAPLAAGAQTHLAHVGVRASVRGSAPQAQHSTAGNAVAGDHDGVARRAEHAGELNDVLHRRSGHDAHGALAGRVPQAGGTQARSRSAAQVPRSAQARRRGAPHFRLCLARSDI